MYILNKNTVWVSKNQTFNYFVFLVDGSFGYMLVYLVVTGQKILIFFCSFSHWLDQRVSKLIRWFLFWNIGRKIKQPVQESNSKTEKENTNFFGFWSLYSTYKLSNSVGVCNSVYSTSNLVQRFYRISEFLFIVDCFSTVLHASLGKSLLN